MSVREWKFRAPELETELHAVSVTCEAPRAILVVNHGINEHVGRYDECASQPLFLCCPGLPARLDGIHVSARKLSAGTDLRCYPEEPQPCQNRCR